MNRHALGEPAGSRLAGYGLTSPLQRFLEQCHEEFRGDGSGQVASYIPELTRADPGHFGAAFGTIDGHVYEVGDSAAPFTIQSVSKAFVFALALDTLGDARVEQAIGVEPSGEAFNSIRLNADNRPFNPMVNAGAIACSGLIRRVEGDGAFERIRQRSASSPGASSTSTRRSTPPNRAPATATAPSPGCCATIR